MISQERINEQIEKEYNFSKNHGCDFSMVDFSNGVEFAIEEIKPMFVEFCYWFSKKVDGHLCGDEYAIIPDGINDDLKTYSVMELFELFLKLREDGHNDL